MAFNDPPWIPITDPVKLKILGKALEELGEGVSIISRCIIQGIDEVEPVTKKPNRQALWEEITDIEVNLHIIKTNLDLPWSDMDERFQVKLEQLMHWIGGLKVDG